MSTHVFTHYKPFGNIAFFACHEALAEGKANLGELAISHT